MGFIKLFHTLYIYEIDGVFPLFSEAFQQNVCNFLMLLRHFEKASAKGGGKKDGLLKKLQESRQGTLKKTALQSFLLHLGSLCGM